MTDENREELLSAYLDGEISAEERARVEKLLAESAEAQHLLDELRSVRSGMKSLPRNELTEDLGPAVLRRAERAAPGAPQPSPVAGKVTPGGLARDWPRGGWRRWAWPAAAIAAALVIALFDTDRKPAERQVAQTRPPQGETFIGARENAEAPAEDAKLRDEVATKRDEKDSNKPEPMLAKKQNAPGGERRMSPGKPKVAAPAAAAAPPAAAKLSIQDAMEPDDDTVTVICDVTPAFTRDREFEKLLSQQKIAYRRGDQRAVKQAEPTDRAQTENLASKQPDEGPYEVDATPEQVDQIITLLRQDVSNVGRIAKDQSAAQSRAKDQRQADENAAPPAQNQAQSRASQRARAQFQFRVVDSLPPQKARN